jgi:hypothetical protein
MTIPEDKQTVVLLLQNLIDQKQTLRSRDYNSQATLLRDRKHIRKFKILSQRMLEKFKIRPYILEHFTDAVRSVERIIFREEGGLWTIDYIPGQHEPVEVHRCIYHLLVRYFNKAFPIPEAELTSTTYNFQCPYCGWPNKLLVSRGEKLSSCVDCQFCYAMVLLPEVENERET